MDWPWIREEALYYDVIIGSGSRMPGLFGIDDWATPEALASVGTVYPGEVMDLLDQKVWAVLRNAERVNITGLQGSDGSFTWFPEWWEIIEGTHPTIRNPGYQSTFGTERPGRSEFAYLCRPRRWSSCRLCRHRTKRLRGSDSGNSRPVEPGSQGSRFTTSGERLPALKEAEITATCGGNRWN